MSKGNVFNPGRRPLLVLAFSIICSLAIGQVPLPYFNDFDSTATGWDTSFTDPGSIWELGMPALAPTNSTHSGLACWDINLSTPYNNEANSVLESPVFLMDSGPFQVLSFWQNFDTEGSWDGLRVDYSVAGGPWLTLGTVGDPNATNWYTDPQLNSSALPAWEGNSSGWIKSTYKIFGLSNQQVQFQFVFTSDFSVTGVGVSIDDFSLTTAPAIDLAATSISVNPPFIIGSISDSVTVAVYNAGQSAATQFTVSYTYNGIVESLLYTDTLLSGDSLEFTLPGFTVVTSSPLCGNVALTGDGDQNNDQVCDTVNGFIIFPLDYSNNFDSSSTGWTVSTTGNSLTSWELGSPSFGSTTGSYSGMNCWDVNLITPYTNNAFTALVSPGFDMNGSNKPSIHFMINYDTETGWDGVRLEYSQNNGPWNVLGTFADTNALNWYVPPALLSSNLPGWHGQPAGWQHCQYNLPLSITTGMLQFRFVFTSDGSVTGTGFSMDDFYIHSQFATDVNMESITKPSANTFAVNNALIVKIKNDGSQVLTNIPVSYIVNGQTPVTVQWNGNLQPGGSTYFTAGSIQLTPGYNTIKVYSAHPQEMFTLNDTVLTTVLFSIPYQLPYSNSFDINATGWGVIPGSFASTWQLGTPTFGTTNSAYSAPACWDINLNSPYTANAMEELVTPPFDISGNNGIQLDFNLNYNTQLNFDGLILYYSTDSLVWFRLGVINDPSGQNWYNSTVAGAGGWSGNSGGWQQVSYSTNQFTNQDGIIFKFQFYSNGALNLDGVSIDDFQLRRIADYDGAITKIFTPAASFNANTPQVTSIELSNYGLNPITSLQVHYSVDNGPVTSQTWNGNLPEDSSTVISFPSQLFSQGPHQLKAWLTWPQDTFPENDTTAINIDAFQPLLVPYSTGFDNGTDNYIVQTTGLNTTSWEYGIPMYGSTNSSHSAPNTWDINLFNPYNNLARTYLVTPPFDFSNLNAVSVNFWLNYNTEVNADGMYVQYTTDDNNWIMLGVLNDPMGNNWYNSNLFNGVAGWTGNSQGWTQVNLNSFQLSGLSYCRLRFVFQSDFNLNGDGLSLDDLSLSIYTGLNEQTGKSFLLYPNPANDIVYLEQLPAGKNNIVILDALGRVVFNEIKSGNARIDCSEFATGTYVVKVETEKGEVSFRKFMKQ